VLKIGIDQSTAGGTAVQPIQRYFFER